MSRPSWKLNNTKPYLIAGIDPGTTTGIAILDFNGEVLNIFSSKDLSLDKVIKHLLEFGRVSLIAVDVNPAPGFVPKLAAQLGSQLFVPEELLHVSEKIEITREYKTKNSHQRDALAAALTAYHKFKNKFGKIDSLSLGDEVKNLVIHGISIDDAVKMLEEKEEEEPAELEIEKKPERIPSPQEIEIRKLEKQNSTLRKEIKAKEKEILRLKKELVTVKASYRLRLRKEKEIEKRDLIIKSLENSIIELKSKLGEIDRLKEILHELARDEIKPVGIFPEIYDGLTMLKRKPRKNELIDGIQIAFIDNLEIARHLRGRGVFTTETKHLNEVAGFAYIRKKNLQAIKKSKKISLDDIVEDYRERR